MKYSAKLSKQVLNVAKLTTNELALLDRVFGAGYYEHGKGDDAAAFYVACKDKLRGTGLLTKFAKDNGYCPNFFLASAHYRGINSRTKLTDKLDGVVEEVLLNHKIIEKPTAKVKPVAKLTEAEKEPKTITIKNPTGETRIETPKCAFIIKPKFTITGDNNTITINIQK